MTTNSDNREMSPVAAGALPEGLRDSAGQMIGTVVITDGCVVASITNEIAAKVIERQILSGADHRWFGWYPEPPRHAPTRIKVRAGSAALHAGIAIRADDSCRYRLCWSAIGRDGPLLGLVLSPVPARPATRPPGTGGPEVESLLAEIAADDKRWAPPPWGPIALEINGRQELAWESARLVMTLSDERHGRELVDYVARLRAREPRLVAALQAAQKDLDAERAQHRADNEGASSALATAEYERGTAEAAVAQVRAENARLRAEIRSAGGGVLRIAELEVALAGLIARVDAVGGYASPEEQAVLRQARAALGDLPFRVFSYAAGVDVQKNVLIYEVIGRDSTDGRWWRLADLASAIGPIPWATQPAAVARNPEPPVAGLAGVVRRWAAAAGASRQAAVEFFDEDRTDPARYREIADCVERHLADARAALNELLAAASALASSAPEVPR